MDKLTGHGRPSPRTVGEVGQHYEDLDTGDIYECRIAQEHSPTHGWPVGGYVWERRAKGEDIREIYGSGGNAGHNDPCFTMIIFNIDQSSMAVTCEHSFDEAFNLVLSKPVYMSMRMDGVQMNGTFMCFAYTNNSVRRIVFANDYNGFISETMFTEDGKVLNVRNSSQFGNIEETDSGLSVIWGAT